MSNSISFFIPAYNCAATIEQAVSSILSTNFSPGDELIVVNDGSDDATAEVLSTLETQLPEISILHHSRNKGGAAARNTAVEASRNELLFCLDADNVLAESSIQDLKQYLLQSDADVASFQHLRYFSKSIDQVDEVWTLPAGLYPAESALADSFSPGASGNYLFTKSSWIRAGGYPEFAGALDTWGFGIRQLMTGSKVVVLANTHYFHRLLPDSYFLRDAWARRRSISIRATQLLIPFFDQLDDQSINYIMSPEGRYTWFDHLDKRPLRLSREEKKDGLAVEQTQLQKIVDEKLPQVKRKVAALFAKAPGFKEFLRKTYLVHFYRKHREVKAKQLAMKDFQSDLEQFLSTEAGTKSRFDTDSLALYPELLDKTSTTPIEPHYTYHPAWAARVLAETKPAKHIDISSTINFCTLVSAFIPVEFYDYRPANLKLSNLVSKQADLSKLPFETGSVMSLSCMHTLEHIGLGRYGDPIDYDGDLKAIAELKRVLAAGGNLLIVTPLGKPRIEYNAHRIYAYRQIISYFEPFQLKEFSLIPDDFEQYGMIRNATEEMADKQVWGCGCFWFSK